MRLEDLIGQTRAAAILRRAILQDRIAHAYLFSGPEGVGKSTASLLFAQALNCECRSPNAAPSGCGKCRSCSLIARGNHPDVRLLTPSDDNHTSVIPIESIRRDFAYDINLRPALGRHKIYILDPADRTAHLAIHTILKALEEPPPYVVTILVTARPALLPPTIPSRCQEIAFQLAGTDAIEDHLLTLGVEPQAAASLARLSGGRIAFAVRAANRPEVLATRKTLLDLCADLPSRAAPFAVRLAEDIKLHALALARTRRELRTDEGPSDDESAESTPASGPSTDRVLRSELPWCLDVMLSWYRDRLAAAQGGALLNPDYHELLAPGVQARSRSNETRAIEAILEAKHTLQHNANIDLALEHLAIELLYGEE